MSNTLNLFEYAGIPDVYDSNKTPREKLLSLESVLLENLDVQQSYPLTHNFVGGMYVRTIFMNAGSVIVGRIHKKDHFVNLLEGDVTIYDEYNGLHRIKAPCSFPSPKGVKRALYIHEDAVFQTIHKLDDPTLRYVRKVEDEMACDTYDELDTFLLEQL